MWSGVAKFDPVVREKFLDVRVWGFRQFRYRTEVDRMTLVQYHDAVGDFAHQVEIVRHDDARQPQLGLQLQHQIAHLLAHDRIDHRRGFVIKDAFGLERERACDGDSAPLTSR